jgi:F-type H+-transporting ATPase subunit delta
MANVDARDMAVGRLYAEAMLALAEEQGKGDALLEELQELVASLDQSPRLAHFLASPLVDEEGRARVIEELFRGRASDLLVDSLQVINRKGRLGQIRAIAEAYRAAHRDQRGWVDVKVRTAVPLSAALRTRLADSIAAFTGKKPSLIEKTDPSLIGGMVVEVEGKKIDASLASRLRDLSAALQARAEREMHGGRAYVAES